MLVESYDIACKYGINWRTRLTQFPDAGSPEDWPEIRRVIPKWHENGHKGTCRWLNSLYYMPGSGQTDGESVERRWAVINALARSIREMGPGHHIDILNFHFSDYNIQKVFNIGTSQSF